MFSFLFRRSQSWCNLRLHTVFGDACILFGVSKWMLYVQTLNLMEFCNTKQAKYNKRALNSIYCFILYLLKMLILLWFVVVAVVICVVVSVVAALSF